MPRLSSTRRVSAHCDATLTFQVPPYVVALALVIILTSFSDWTKRRGAFAASTFIIDLVGWAILLGTSPTDPSAQHARYFGAYAYCEPC